MGAQDGGETKISSVKDSAEEGPIVFVILLLVRKSKNV